MPPLLEADHVTQTFDKNVALAEMSFGISDERPSFTAIVGESGSGKTTMARALLGLLQPTGGQIRYRSKDLYRMRGKERQAFHREVQAIFQDPFEVYNPFYKVDHLLAVPMRKFGLAPTRDAADELVERALRDVGLVPEETLGRYPHQLSGGQRQRLTVARGLLIRPRLIVADEPVSMVDASLRKTILGTLRHLNQDFGISFVYITHDLATAHQVSENIIVLYKGVVAEAGEVSRVIKQARHPYTQLLVNSVPKPDPARRWADEDPVDVPANHADGDATSDQPAHDGCVFAGRCPQVMPMCTRSRPPLYRVHDHQAAACFLHRETPNTVEGDVSQVFRSP